MSVSITIQNCFCWHKLNHIWNQSHEPHNSSFEVSRRNSYIDSEQHYPIMFMLKLTNHSKMAIRIIVRSSIKIKMTLGISNIDLLKVERISCENGALLIGNFLWKNTNKISYNSDFSCQNLFRFCKQKNQSFSELCAS